MLLQNRGLDLVAGGPLVHDILQLLLVRRDGLGQQLGVEGGWLIEDLGVGDVVDRHVQICDRGFIARRGEHVVQHAGKSIAID